MLWLLLVAGTLAAADLDHDTVPDNLEQQLLERFVPRFLVSPGDCDLLPSAFAMHEGTPRPLGRHDTLYGFVTPHATGEIEMHYYHLWARDCGRVSHPLDVEHVSVLLRGEGGHWRAVAWMAAGHQGTICDTAHGAPARALDAEEHGPTVWISQGKHASFFSQSLCSRGCGGDRCDDARAWHPREIVNLGALDHPLNGASWVQSHEWPLAAKLRPEFTPAVQTVLSRAEGLTNLYPVLVPLKATVMAGSTTLEALGTGKSHAESSMATGASNVSDSLRKARRAVSNFLSRW